MKVASNKIADIKSFTRKHLKGLYPEEEINSFIYMLFEAYCSLSKTELLAGKREYINESELLLVYDAVKALEQHKPIQYILGKTTFYGLDFILTPAVLIPRPETEELVGLILEENKNNTRLKILDIGTGSGCIAVALKKNIPGCKITAIDISDDALAIARQNAKKNGVDVTFISADILNENQWRELGTYDIIVSNPPYVLESEKSMMQLNVLNYEPASALFVPDTDPLRYYEAIFRFARRQQKKTKIYVEINESMGAELITTATNKGLSDVAVIKDLNQKDRFLSGSINALNQSIIKSPLLLLFRTCRKIFNSSGVIFDIIIKFRKTHPHIWDQPQKTDSKSQNAK